MEMLPIATRKCFPHDSIIPPSGCNATQLNAQDAQVYFQPSFSNNTYLQTPLLHNLLISLHLIPHLKFRPVLKAQAAFVTLSHLSDVFLYIFQG